MSRKSIQLVRDRFKKTVPRSDIKLPPDTEKFFREIIPSIAAYLPVNLSEGASFERTNAFVNELYLIAVNATIFVNWRMFERSIPAKVRADAIRLNRARAHVANSHASLEEAKKVLGNTAKSFVPGILTFTELLRGLKRLERVLDESECAAAVLIPPPLRTKREKYMAAKIRLPKIEHSDNISAKSAELQYQTVQGVEEAVRRFTCNRVKSTKLNNFIVEFFKHGLGMTISADNVKMIRIRIKRKKVTPPQSPQ